MNFTAEQKRKEVSREIAMRNRVYPQWVQSGRMSKADADRQIEIMKAIEADYREKEKAEDPQGKLV